MPPAFTCYSIGIIGHHRFFDQIVQHLALLFFDTVKLNPDVSQMDPIINNGVHWVPLVFILCLPCCHFHFFCSYDRTEQWECWSCCKTILTNKYKNGKGSEQRSWQVDCRQVWSRLWTKRPIFVSSGHRWSCKLGWSSEAILAMFPAAFPRPLLPYLCAASISMQFWVKVYLYWIRVILCKLVLELVF